MTQQNASKYARFLDLIINWKIKLGFLYIFQIKDMAKSIIYLGHFIKHKPHISEE